MRCLLWIGPTTARNKPTSPDESFAAQARSLERSYLQSEDPMVQSGFSGGRKRWVAERSPIVNAIHRDGDFLDVGCANGLLAEDVVTWAGEHGFALTPHGIDLGASLVDLARQRLPDHRQNFHMADAWGWDPKRQWTFVYSLLDLSPQELWCDWLYRLSTWVEPEGRLIIGSYGADSRGVQPTDVANVMENCGLQPLDFSHGGDPLMARFAWSRAEPP